MKETFELKLFILLIIGSALIIGAISLTTKPYIKHGTVRIQPLYIEAGAFRQDMYAVLLNRKEPNQVRRGAAIAATAFLQMVELQKVNPELAVQQGWNAVKQNRDIYGQNSLKTQIVLKKYLAGTQWNHHYSMNQEFL